MSELFLNIVNMSLSASIVMLAVLALRLLLKGAPKKWSYLLWSVVGFRLCCPVSVRAVFSLFRALPARLPAAEVAAPASVPASAMEYVPRNIAYMSRPQVNVGVLAVNNVVNGSLPAATPQASMNPMQFWIFLAALIWVAGMAVLLVVSLWNYHKTRRRVLDAVRMERGVYETDAISSPFILGFFRPVIYLPLGLNGERRRYVLEHERYHLKRKDHLTRLFAFLLLAIHWFNPLVWLGYYLMGKDMEMSCDEAVLGMEEGREKEYSATLLSFAVAGRFPGLLAFGEASVKSRIRNALNWRRPRTWVSLVAGVLCVALVAACAVNPAVESPVESVGRTQVLLDELEQSIVFENGLVSFRLPNDYFEAQGWKHHISGRAVYGDGMTMSRHFLEEPLEPGKVYSIDPTDLTELTMVIATPGGEERTFDLLSYIPVDAEPIPAMMQIPIPEEYGGLVEVESTVDRVSVYEKKSREDFRADFEKNPWPDYDHPDQVGMGWLCSIERVSEADAQYYVKTNVSGGAVLFGKDDQGGYYFAWYPTDVRCYRTGGTLSAANVAQWEELTRWSRTLPDDYLDQHHEVTPFTEADITIPPSPYEGLEGMDLLNAVLAGLADENGPKGIPTSLCYSGPNGATRYYDGTTAWNGKGYAYGIVNHFTYSLSSASQPEGGNTVVLAADREGWVLWFCEDTPDLLFLHCDDSERWTWVYRATPKTEDIFSPNPYTLARSWFDECEYQAWLTDYDGRHLTYPGPDTDYLLAARLYASGYERLHANLTDGSKYKYSYETTRVQDAPEATESHRRYDGAGDKTWAFTTITVFVPENQRAERECWAGNTMDYAEYLAEGGKPVDGQIPEGALVYFRCGYITRQEDGTWKGSIVGTGW